MIISKDIPLIWVISEQKLQMRLLVSLLLFDHPLWHKSQHVSNESSCLFWVPEWDARLSNKQDRIDLHSIEYPKATCNPYKLWKTNIYCVTETWVIWFLQQMQSIPKWFREQVSFRVENKNLIYCVSAAMKWYNEDAW